MPPIGLGNNLGDADHHARPSDPRAASCRACCASRLYPHARLRHDHWVINAVAVVETTLAPMALLVLARDRTPLRPRARSTANAGDRVPSTSTCCCAARRNSMCTGPATAASRLHERAPSPWCRWSRRGGCSDPRHRRAGLPRPAMAGRRTSRRTLAAPRTGARDGADRKPWTVPMLGDLREAGRKLMMLCCYDIASPACSDDNGVDLILVRFAGHGRAGATTRPYQCRSATSPTTSPRSRGGAAAQDRCADLPFGADATPEQAHAAAVRFIRPARRWSSWRAPAGDHPLPVDREIPVCAHLRADPQSVLRFGGFKVQGTRGPRPRSARRCPPWPGGRGLAGARRRACLRARRRSPRPARSRPSASARVPAATARCWQLHDLSSIPAIANRASCAFLTGGSDRLCWCALTSMLRPQR